MAYNGEVYNYVELSQELSALGWTFCTTSDTEVVLAALVTWGVDALQRFNGMWAIALVDWRKREVLISRDRLGVKPLFIRQVGTHFYFGSTIRAITELSGMSPRPSLERLANFLNTSIVEAPGESWFEDFAQVEPGTWSVISGTGRRSGRYYSLPKSTQSVPDVGLREVFQNAVDIRLRADVPVAMCLSSGIDSSLILAAAAKRTSSIVAFTSRSDGYADSEHRAAAELAKSLGIEIHEVVTDSSQFDLEEFSSLTTSLEYPTDSPAVIPFARIMRSVRAYGRIVALDGQGADEAFNGYLERTVPYHMGYMARRRQMREVIQSFGVLSGALGPRLAGAYTFRSWLPSVHRVVQRRRGGQVTFGALMPSGNAAQMDRRPSWDGGALAAKRYLVSVSLPSLLFYGDRLSMREGVELRQPFMDFRVLEYGLTSNFEDQTRGGKSKSQLREMASELLPRADFPKRKLGFPTPVVAWMRLPEIREFLLDSSIVSDGVLDTQGVNKMIRMNHSANSTVLGLTLFRILGAAIWWERYS